MSDDVLGDVPPCAATAGERGDGRSDIDLVRFVVLHLIAVAGTLPLQLTRATLRRHHGTCVTLPAVAIASHEGDVRTFIIVGLSVGLMVFFLRHASLGRVWEELLGARWDLLGAGLVATLGTYLFRVERWRHLLRPIGSIRFSPAFRATIMGFAANSLMPGRVGEVLRPYLLARSERVSGTAAFATIVIERLLDLLVVCLFFSGVMLLFELERSTADASLLATIKQGATVAKIVAVAALGVMFAVAGDPERAGSAVRRVSQAVPGGRVHRLTMFTQRFLEGLAVTR